MSRETFRSLCSINQLILYLLLICFSDWVATESEFQQGWCLIPGLPLRITEAFYQHNQINVPVLVHGDWYRADTTAFVRCIEGYTAIKNHSLRITCVKNQPGQAHWNGTLPTCKRNVCWWHGSEEANEFRYGDQKLADQADGFPEGTTVHNVCPSGMVATNSSFKFLSYGNWSDSMVPAHCPEQTLLDDKENSGVRPYWPYLVSTMTILIAIGIAAVAICHRIRHNALLLEDIASDLEKLKQGDYSRPGVQPHQSNRVDMGGE